MESLSEETMPESDMANRKKQIISGPSCPAPTPFMGIARTTTDSAPEEIGSNINDTAGKTLSNLRQNDTSSRLASQETIQRPSLTAQKKVAPLPEDYNTRESNWLVSDDGLRHIPSYYPLEKSSRYVTDAKPSEIANRISDCCRIMSIQASFDNKLGTAELKTAEHVEIHVSLWQASDQRYPDCTVVEAQRRRGCVMVYHKYCRNLLDAAQGEFDPNTYAMREDMELKYSKPDLTDRKPRAKVPGEDSLLALEIAASLLKKDRMDARQLGMESLCLLTDPSKTGIETALLASRAVLFGTIQDESIDDVEFLQDELGVREAVLSLVQFGRLGDGDSKEGDDTSEESIGNHPEEKEFNNILHNLALAVLANSLEVLQNHSSKISPNGSSKPSDAANVFLEESSEISKRELISTLLSVLNKAEANPHEACLSAQCLRSLFNASKKARRKAREMNAKEIVLTALEVGKKSHVKLETETENVMRVLEHPDEDDANDDEN